MRHMLSSLALVAALSLPALAAAQDAGAPLQQQMSADEFKAAGLDKLSAEELANLNRWLNRRIDSASTAAAAEATERVQNQSRGFLSFGPDEVIQANLVGEFRGFERNRVYRLDNGQKWQQTDAARLEGVRRSNPAVTINSGAMGAWYMRIDGHNTRAKVRRIK